MGNAKEVRSMDPNIQNHHFLDLPKSCLMESVPLMFAMSDDDESTVLATFSSKNGVHINSRAMSHHHHHHQEQKTFSKFISSLCLCFSHKTHEGTERIIHIGIPDSSRKYSTNAIQNKKYNVLTFIPLVLYEQFKFFLNLYFLIMAFSQFIPAIRVGYLYTYWGPLTFVILVNMLREAVDDIKRLRRDKEVNSQVYRCWRNGRLINVCSSKLRVSDIVIVEKDQRVPADIVLLSTTTSGSCFIRTDQLDGETDWKLKISAHATQNKLVDINETDPLSRFAHSLIRVEPPRQALESFEGILISDDGSEESLSVDNVLWSGTVLATRSVMGCVVYTGKDTRMAMNAKMPRAKVGLLDLEINTLTKLLFAVVVILALVMVTLKGFQGPWYRYFIRFVILFSYIIPISLRVNLDMGKLVYSYFISGDKKYCPNSIVRSSTISEELGRIGYLLSDKTGTLTRNEMLFKRLRIENAFFSNDMLSDIRAHIENASKQSTQVSVLRHTTSTRVYNTVKAIALCHNVTPDGAGNYQAASPDEVALVKFCEEVGITLWKRDLNTIFLRNPDGKTFQKFSILHLFPFTSERKRMGLILKSENGIITFMVKGADTVIAPIVRSSEWMCEEASNFAREGLRILVYAQKVLSMEQYSEFDTLYAKAKLSIIDRTRKCWEAIETLERDMELLCVTGVEDRLQADVHETLESLRHAGIRIWMLTGDKKETAACIARSSRLFTRDQTVHYFSENQLSYENIATELNALEKNCENTALVISGASLHVVLSLFQKDFIKIACRCPAVVVCRCSPTQKADVVQALKQHTKQRIAAVGDGGNDVSMIQKAHAGIGIVGKEGKQASLAADFSITQFSHVAPLILVHGRNCYKRSAALAQFVMHRGLVISTIQAVFSSIFYAASIALYQGFLMIGYATVYTMFPVFSLVLDKDVSPEVALTYPEIYRDIQKGRSLNFKTFFIWLLISIYQGGAIMYLSLFLFEDQFVHVVSITYTSLILTELLMIALMIRTWHYLMILAEFLSLICYGLSLVIFHSYLDAEFLLSWTFCWKVLVITAVSCLPFYIIKYFQIRFSPSVHTKLMQVGRTSNR